MDNLELSEWMRTRLATLDPPADWEPSVAIARGRLEGRLRHRSLIRRHISAGVAAVVIVCAILSGVPRVVAQPVGGNGWYPLDQAWYWLTMQWQGPGIKLANLGALPESVKALHAEALSGLASAEAVADVTEASRRVGFDTRLPRGLGTPRVSALGPTSMCLDVRTADLETALRNAGVREFDVPRSWDGARIGLSLGATVIARWPGRDQWSGLTLAQRPVPVVSAPAGFDVQEFAVANLRVGHMNRQNALRFARLPNIGAGLLIGDGTQSAVLVREVDLRTGPATLLEELENGPIWRLSLLWSVADRVYALSGVLNGPVAFMSPEVARGWMSLASIANTID